MKKPVTKKSPTPQVPALPGMTPLGLPEKPVVTYVPMIAEALWIDGQVPRVILKNRFALALELPFRFGRAGTYFKRFGVLAVPRGQEGRRVMDGPMVPGPWADTFGLCTVIDNFPEKRAAERATDIVVTDGRLIEIDRVTYRAKVYDREYINLVEVK